MKFCWVLGFISLGALPVSAQLSNTVLYPRVQATKQDPFSDPLIQQVELRQRKAVAGDTQETKALTADLERWTKEQPQNHLLQAYLGSAYTLSSRDAWPGPGKLTYLRNGGQLLDAAVAADPTNPAVRFVRAIDYFQLPSIFGKRQVARDDFEILLQEVDGETKTSFVLSTETAQAIYYYAGLSLEQQWQTPEAKKVWRKGLNLDPTSALGLKIQAELEKAK
jgi:cytochrome c-type biogenesis protein CcmH/NrfG